MLLDSFTDPRSSFCKSQSGSYADLLFQYAHLESQYPAQYLSSVIANGHGFYTREVYLDAARRRGIRILPLDVNASHLSYHGRDNWIRPGLFSMRDCRAAAMKVLVQEREENGPYKDLIDLVRRVPLHKREYENLISAGGMGCFGLNPPELRDCSLMQKCMDELRILGYVLSANLLHVVGHHILARNAVRATELRHHVGRRVKVLGIPVTDRLHPVSRGDNGVQGDRSMTFLTLGDNSGHLDVSFRQEALDTCGDSLAGQAPFSGILLEVWGKVTEDRGAYAVEADEVRVAQWLPNQVDFRIASKRLQEGMRNYPAYTGVGENAGEKSGAGLMAA